eukprot:m.189921 g.189921  ORF g.189921 m.189921 type:complete len:535 (-) comp15633_c0_seq20:16-1620(-)
MAENCSGFMPDRSDIALTADTEEQMEELLKISVLMLAIFLLSWIFRKVKAELLGGIVAGFLLGPVLEWIVFEKATYMVGRLGLILLVMQGGLGVDVQYFRKTWLFTTNLAITGTIVPVLLGWLVMYLADRDTIEGFAAGTALSSTSIGMSIMMLIQFNYLKTPLGGIIAVAAMVDDVASLVILAVLQEIGRSQDDATSPSDWAEIILKPIGISLGVIAAGVVLTIITPIIYFRMEKRWDSYYANKIENAAERKKEVEAWLNPLFLFFLVVITIGSSIASGYAGSSYLLGAFAAGMAFSQIREEGDSESRAETLWKKHASLGWWLASVSFATLGFSVPYKALFSLEGFSLGMLYVIPAFFGKFLLGLLVPNKDGNFCNACGFCNNIDDALIVGLAMATRGELGFVMAQTAVTNDIMGDTTYAACVWALFICTLIPPLFFGRVLERKQRRSVKQQQVAQEHNEPVLEVHVPADLSTEQESNETSTTNIEMKTQRVLENEGVEKADGAYNGFDNTETDPPRESYEKDVKVDGDGLVF